MPLSLNEYFAARRSLLDAALNRIANASGAPPVLDAALKRAFASPGKRVRGILTIAVAESLGVRPEKVLDAAAAMEMIHTSSLILDDLPAMDDAILRRGEPALHRLVGEDIAILAAVALLNHAYGFVAQSHAALRPRRWPLDQVLQRVVSAVGWDGSVAGESVDLHSEGASLDFDTLEFIHSRKTGALFVAAASLGGMLANIHPAPLQRIEVFAKNLGLAFQITDDILDVVGTPEQIGKDVGKDEQRLTFVKLAGVEGARKLSAELVETSLQAIEGLKAPALRDLAILVRDRVR